MEDLIIMLIVLNIFIVINLVLIDFWFLWDRYRESEELNEELKKWKERE